MWLAHLSRHHPGCRVGDVGIRRCAYVTEYALDNSIVVSLAGRRCVSSSSSGFGAGVDARLRRAGSLSALRLLCERRSAGSPGSLPASCLSQCRSGCAINLAQLPPAGQLYVLRLIDSSGVLWCNGSSSSSSDAAFARRATLTLLSSLEDLSSCGALSQYRSKHSVGLVWHIVKFASSLVSSADPTCASASPLGEGPVSPPGVPHRYQSHTVPSDPREVAVNSHVSRLDLAERCLLAACAALQRFVDGSVVLNGKDLQQLLMLVREDVFTALCVSSSSCNGGRHVTSPALASIESASLSTLDSLKILASKYCARMSCIELCSVLVSCLSKGGDMDVMRSVMDQLEERSSEGTLRLGLRDCIAFLNASKRHQVSDVVLHAIFSQLECCSFLREDDDAVSGAPCAPGACDPTTVDPQLHDRVSMDATSSESGSFVTDELACHRSFQQAKLSDIGRLCKSMYHLECPPKLLQNLERKLCSTFSSLSPHFFTRARCSTDAPHLSSVVSTMAHMMHLFAKRGYNGNAAVVRVLDVLPRIVWDECSCEDLKLMVDICWSMLVLKVNVFDLVSLLDCVLPNLGNLPVMHSVKLLGGFYTLLGNSNKLSAESKVGSVGRQLDMDAILAGTLESGLPSSSCATVPTADVGEADSSTCDKEIARRYIEKIRESVWPRLLEIKDLQGISNYVFYVTSTVGGMMPAEYSVACDRWLELDRARCGGVKVEAVTQMLWSLQRARIYHEHMLLRLRDLVWQYTSHYSVGQLSLVSHSMTSYNLQSGEFARALLNRLDEMFVKHPTDRLSAPREHNEHLWDVKVVSVLWSIVVSGFDSLYSSDIKVMLRLLGRVDWSLFLNSCQYQDLRKVLQIQSSLQAELPDLCVCSEYTGSSSSSPASPAPAAVIPENVLRTAVSTSQTVRDQSTMSVSQDKVRRALDRLGVRYMGEYELQPGINVDFALSRDNDSLKFTPDLVLEIDGPHHFNVVCGECEIPFVRVGDLRLVPNGRTRYRNRIIQKLGFPVETMSWLDSHRYPVHQRLFDILLRHQFQPYIKQK